MCLWDQWQHLNRTLCTLPMPLISTWQRETIEAGHHVEKSWLKLIASPRNQNASVVYISWGFWIIIHLLYPVHVYISSHWSTFVYLMTSTVVSSVSLLLHTLWGNSTNHFYTQSIPDNFFSVLTKRHALCFQCSPTHTRGKWRSGRHLKHDMLPYSIGQLGITLHEAVIIRPISHHAMFFFWSPLVTRFYSIWHLSMHLLGAHLTKTYQ